MKYLAGIALVLVLLLVSLSSYLRLDESGIGCEPWPQCYGHIGRSTVDASQQPLRDTYERLAVEAQMPLSWATPWHRLIASVVGVLVLALTGVAFIRRRDRLLALSVLALTVFLAWLGIYSDGLQSVAVVMGNLTGGFLMLGLLGWMVLRKPKVPPASSQGFPVLPAVALMALAVQILLGGFTSANFAAIACPGLPECHGRLLPHADVVGAFDISRNHRVDEQGFVIVAATQRAGIHQLHRLSGVLTFILVVLAGFSAIRRDRRMIITGTALIALVCLELGVGVAAVLTNLPIGLAVAHNWLAAIIVLLLLKLLADERANLASSSSPG